MDSHSIPDFTNRKVLEKYSSAFTLSDMEIFIFPELFYPLVLANIMSPQLWEWRNDSWFSDMGNKGFNYRVNRIKQFIIQNYVFNLDLSTWGLTTKTRELDRFREFFDMDLLKQSNALFGYEGDKYYFDIDIRKHFGLDKYNSDVIPYWKTETLEAMTAFRHRKDFNTGAGECVSLSALYAAAMFVVGRIPLEKIFLIATPLHSQNFINEKEGLITNNRRIVTKNMWFNGTSLSERARRAIENEKITIVSHISGYIHTIYRDATINRDSFDLFTVQLKEFLKTELTDLIFINFLRFKSKYKSLFQVEFDFTGKRNYILLEKMFEYEHSSKHKASPESRSLLVQEIEGDDFHLSPLQGKILLNPIEEIIRQNRGNSLKEIEQDITGHCGLEYGKQLREMFVDIADFISTDPKLPPFDKNFIESAAPDISTDDDREKVLNRIIKSSKQSETALLSLYIYRDMDRISWLPFIKAAIERNPVCLKDLSGKTTEDVYIQLNGIGDESIYPGNRIAQPDEVWNFKRGDGIEKAILMADYIINNEPSSIVKIEADHKEIRLISGASDFSFESNKNFRKSFQISASGYLVI